MKKNTKCIILLYFNDNSHDFLIFNNRLECDRYFKRNDIDLLLKDLKSYQIIFGYIQDSFNNFKEV